MVPCELYESGIDFDSPRIRGDGPGRCLPLYTRNTFSPYSRGWSPVARTAVSPLIILPVFAGMVRVQTVEVSLMGDSPRIRGDGPLRNVHTVWQGQFSPYSRGWSQHRIGVVGRVGILPVFAGMVRVRPPHRFARLNSPRIRGDGP